MTQFHINPNSGTVSRCRAKNKCPFGGESGKENHFESASAAREGFEKLMNSKTLPEKSNQSRESFTHTKDSLESFNLPSLDSLSPSRIETLVNMSSAEYGNDLRTYKRLLAYRNFEMAKDLQRVDSGFKDSKTIEEVIKYSRIMAVVEDKKVLLNNLERWHAEAETSPKRAGYKRRIKVESGKLETARKEVFEAYEKIGSLKKFYERKIRDHEVAVKSLHSYHEQVRSGAIPPAPLAMPLDKLSSESKQIIEGEAKAKHEYMLANLNSRNFANIVKAAQMSENAYHVESARGYQKHSEKIMSLNSKIEVLKDQFSENIWARKKSETVASDILEKSRNLDLTLAHEERVKKAYATRLELFRSEVKDNLAYYSRAAEEVKEIIEFGADSSK